MKLSSKTRYSLRILLQIAMNKEERKMVKGREKIGAVTGQPLRIAGWSRSASDEDGNQGREEWEGHRDQYAGIPHSDS